MIIKTRVKKTGKPEDYINLPMLNKLTGNTDDFVNCVAAGAIQNAVELDDCFELTIVIWDKFIKQEVEYIKDNNGVKPSAISIEINT
jgi:hypothetical protein